MNTPSERARIIKAHELDLKLREEAIIESRKRADALKRTIDHLKAEDAEQTAKEWAAKTKTDA